MKPQIIPKTQTISAQFRRVRESYNFSIGIDAYPQHTVLGYKYMGKEYPEVKRSVFNIAPRANLRWNFDKHTNLRLRYQGRTSQPSMINTTQNSISNKTTYDPVTGVRTTMGTDKEKK